VALWFCAALGLASIVFAVASFAFRLQPLVFRSGSMSPEIQAGALALAKEVPASQVEIGDVVSVIDGDGQRVTHRVTTVETSGDQALLTLKGDANEQPDAEPYVVSTVDRVVMDVPYLGYLAAWLSGPVGTFLAGLVVAGVVFSLLRPRTERSRGRRIASSRTLTTAVVLGLLAPIGVAQHGATGTRAAFSDTANFEAGVIGAHRVGGFDWQATHCVNNGSPGLDGYYPRVRFQWQVRDARYETLWTSPGLLAPKVDSQVAAAGTGVFTEFGGGLLGIGSDFSSPGLFPDSVNVTGRSRLRITPSWISETSRVHSVDRSAGGGIRCGGPEVPPALSVTQPTTSGSRPSFQTGVTAGCGAAVAACGTAAPSGGKTITNVQYELQRQNFFGTQCWDPNALFGATYGFFACGWRTATWSSGTGTRTWSVPGSNAYTSSGTYTLTVRTTDSSGQITTRVLTFTVS
jgi:signal peptidase I